MEYIMMLLFTNIEPFFIFIQSLLGGGAESCGKNRIRQKYNEFRDGGGSFEHTAVPTTAHATGCLD